jgi:hypothetical protein
VVSRGGGRERDARPRPHDEQPAALCARGDAAGQRRGAAPAGVPGGCAGAGGGRRPAPAAGHERPAARVHGHRHPDRGAFPPRRPVGAHPVRGVVAGTPDPRPGGHHQRLRPAPSNQGADRHQRGGGDPGLAPDDARGAAGARPGPVHREPGALPAGAGGRAPHQRVRGGSQVHGAGDADAMGPGREHPAHPTGAGGRRDQRRAEHRDPGESRPGRLRLGAGAPGAGHAHAGAGLDQPAAGAGGREPAPARREIPLGQRPGRRGGSPHAARRRDSGDVADDAGGGGGAGAERVGAGDAGAGAGGGDARAHPPAARARARRGPAARSRVALGRGRRAGAGPKRPRWRWG